ncbi:MAG: sugar phosphate nucleotidyltransferase [Clostridia bacterium]|nr:sugar phosphate nucleotidyltransferase [Clostridia bacterium]
MGVQAIIMAGGEGTRLRPLTCGLPKPLVPVLDQPVMAYSLQLLRRHGIPEAGATLHYLPELIEQRFGDGMAYGLDLRYWEEERPVGTAGSVRLAMDALDDAFFVLSGDGLTDCDLTAAMDFHRRSGALVTLVMKRVPVPLEYGVVITQRDGRIQRFVEKPGWGEVFSDTVNTGIYILQKEVLERIPADTPFDFGRDLFPLLVREKQAVYGWVMDGYWCDIGGQEAYLQAQADFLEGRISLDTGVEPDGRGNRVAPGAKVSADAALDGPCWIGEGARVEAGAYIGLHAVLGAESWVEAGASVKQATLWRGARIGARAQIRGAVVCQDATVGPQARLFEGGTVGDGSELGERCELAPGVKVWPGKRVEAGCRLASNLVWGDCARCTVDASGALAGTPEQAAMLGAAWLRAAKAQDMGLMCAPGAMAQAQYAAVSSGLIAQGACVTLLGEGTLPMLRIVQRLLSLPAGIFVHGTRLEMTGSHGCPPSRDLQRSIESLAQRQDYPRPFAHELYPPRFVQDARAFYVGALVARADARGLAPFPLGVAVFAHSREQRDLAQEVLEALRLKGRTACGPVQVDGGEIGFLLSEDGQSVTVFDAQITPEEGQQALLRYAALLHGGVRCLFAPTHAPRALEELAGRVDATVRRVKSAREAMMKALLDPEGEPPALEERLWQMDVQYDGLCAALAIVGMLAARQETLQEALASLPVTFRVSRDVPCALADKGRVLRALAEENQHADLTDGLCVDFNGGWAMLIPSTDGDGASLRVLAESQRVEFAQELCDRFTRRTMDLVRRE